MPTVTPSTTNELGIKGVGETGTIASPPAVLNAVVDALLPLGVTEIGRPASPERLAGDPRREGQGSEGRERRCGMIPAPFEYVRVGSVEEAIAALGSHEDAKLLAGGHSSAPRCDCASRGRPAGGHRADLRPVVRARGRRPRRDRRPHPPSRRREQRGARLAVPDRRERGRAIGDPQVRHMGTIGGSVAHGDPAGDLPSVLLALDADFTAQGPNGTRTIAAGDFFPRCSTRPSRTTRCSRGSASRRPTAGGAT